MSPHIEASTRTPAPDRRLFHDADGRAWEVIAAPHPEAGGGSASFRLYFRCTARAGTPWLPGPVVEAVRFSDERLARVLEKILTALRSARSEAREVRPPVSAAPEPEVPSAEAAPEPPVRAEDYVGFGASARPDEWLPDFDDQFELVP